MKSDAYKTGDLCKRYVLRLTPEGDRFGWQAVKGRRFQVYEWWTFPMFTYRDGVVCYAVHEPTGLTIAVGPTHQHAMEETVRFIARQVRRKHEFFNALMEASRKLPTGPNPGPTYDTRTASETPRRKAHRCRQRPKEPAPLQGV